MIKNPYTKQMRNCHIQKRSVLFLQQQCRRAHARKLNQQCSFANGPESSVDDRSEAREVGEPWL